MHCLLVGAGQPGSRYLQGLAGIYRQLNITVVDPSVASLDLARQRLDEVSLATSHQVMSATSLDEAPNHLDLALVVTPAHCRTDVVAVIKGRHEVSAWILEKVPLGTRRFLHESDTRRRIRALLPPKFAGTAAGRGAQPTSHTVEICDLIGS